MSKSIDRIFCLVMIFALLLGIPQHAAQAASFQPAASGRNAVGNLPGTAGWTTQSNAPEANFGAAVAPAGDVNNDGYADFLVGAPGYDGAATDTGRAYLYYGSASGPRLGWFVDTSAATSKLGTNLAGIGDVNGDGYDDIAISAPFYEYGGETDEGTVYVWHGGADMDCGYATCSVSTTVSTADWHLDGQQSYAYLSHIAGGDVNNDGYSDLVVGIPYIDNYGVVDVGGVFVWYGSSSGLNYGYIPSEPRSAQWKAYGTNTNDRIGYHVAVLDVKSGGGADVFASAPYYSNGQAEEGAVFGWYSPLSGDGTVDNANWKVESNEAAAHLGWRLNPAGDVDGNGWGDLITSAPVYGASDAGKVYVFTGAANGSGFTGSGAPGAWTDANTAASWTAVGDEANAQLGYSVSSAGDINQDGRDDVLIGSHLYGSSDTGKVFVFLTDSTSLSCHGTCPVSTSNADWSAVGTEASDDFGKASVGVGDANGNGAADILVGAPRMDTAGEDGGKIFLYYNINQNPLAVADTPAAGREDQVMTVAAPGVLANDVNESGVGTLTASLVSAPATGSVVLNSNGSFTYTPASNYFGAVTFTYRAYNGSFYSDPATVYLSLSAVNDAPSFTKGADVTIDRTSTTTVTIPGWATHISSGPANESGQTLQFLYSYITNVNYCLNVSIDPVSGNLTFTPGGEQNGTCTVHTYLKDNGGTANGGSDVSSEQAFSITVLHNNAPDVVDDTAGTQQNVAISIPVLANDSDADGDTLTITSVGEAKFGTAVISGTQILYTPAADYIGTDRITYAVSDGTGHTGSAKVDVTIRNANTPPVAVDDEATLGGEPPKPDTNKVGGDTGTVYTFIDVLANDTDADGDPLSITALTQPVHGTATIAAGPADAHVPTALSQMYINYTVNSTFFGTDTFTYTISDGFATDTAQVTVLVMPLAGYIIFLPAVIHP
ncbi:MAG TPA: Ig-like domain-containing protein [Anaerolineaceae bacterium]|nr:Ig-like domain-containing protein [Anaerolineaceae bacterium]HPN53427.1 Ig-like domain-containing protein [Anaerolineaceae bacterium]